MKSENFMRVIDRVGRRFWSAVSARPLQKTTRQFRDGQSVRGDKNTLIADADLQSANSVTDVNSKQFSQTDGPTPILAEQMTDEQWLNKLIQFSESQSSDGLFLPAFPAPSWQKQFVGSSNAPAMNEAAGFIKLIKEELARLGQPLSSENVVVDFGTGWGRYIRLMMRYIPKERLFGLDVDPDMIGFCKISGLPANFSVVPSFGPTTLADSSVDLIYAYSVFSHLSESAHSAWMEEFRRILKPSGVLIFTTQARRFLSWTETLRSKPVEGMSLWEQSLAKAFPDLSKTVSDYDSGKFIFAPTGGGDYRAATFYGETAIPEKWLRLRWQDQGFVLRNFIDDLNRCGQAAVVMQRTS